MNKVPPTSIRFSRQLIGELGEPWMYRSDLGAADVQPGQTTRVILGGTGRAVIGRILLPAGYAKPVEWRYGRIDLSISPGLPERYSGMTDPEKRAAIRAWLTTDEGKAYQRNPIRHYSTMIDDGSFRIDDVASGFYRLSVSVYAPPSGRFRINGPTIGATASDITVSPAENGGSDESLDLGELQLEPVKPQQ